jgi:hypothetical protein
MPQINPARRWLFMVIISLGLDRGNRRLTAICDGFSCLAQHGQEKSDSFAKKGAFRTVQSPGMASGRRAQRASWQLAPSE